MAKKILSAEGDIHHFIPTSGHKVYVKVEHMRDSEQGFLDRRNEYVQLEIGKEIYDHLVKEFMKQYHHEIIPGKDKFRIELNFIYLN
jgi:hypothetical protein